MEAQRAKSKANSPLVHQKDEPTMSPDEYGRILEGVQLRSLVLTEVSASADIALVMAQAGKGGVPLTVSERAEFSVNDTVTVKQFYDITCQSGRKKCFRLQATYELGFESAEGFSEEFFEIFRRVSLPLYSWPYLRELAQNMAARMGLPPLVLPLVRFGQQFDGSEEEEAE